MFGDEFDHIFDFVTRSFIFLFLFLFCLFSLFLCVSGCLILALKFL